MDSWTFIKQAAEAMNIKPEAFKKWRINGVPRMYRLEIVEAAQRAGFDLDRDIFDHPPRRQKTQAA